AIRALADTTADIPPLDVDAQKKSWEWDWPMAIPPAPEDARFRRVSISKREQVARAYSAGWPDSLLRAMEYKQQVDFTPVLPPKKGHISMIMSSGVRGIMRLDKDGREMLAKGRTIKKAVTRTEENEKGSKVTITTYQPHSVIGTVSGDGIQVIDEVDGLIEFMKGYGDVLAERILEDNQPLYNPLHPPAKAWAHLGTLSKNRRPLPGQAEAGMLDTQKHVAIAMARAMNACNTGLIQGEMGTGKTTVSLAVTDMMDAYPALVVCPPHLVPKWRREAEEVIPGVETRELSRIGKTASMDHEVNDVRAFVEDWEAGLLGDKAIAVVSSTSAKLGSGWEGAMAKRYALPYNKKDDRGPFRNALARYEEAREELKELRRGGASENKLAGQCQKLRTLRRAALDEAIAYPVCPVCGQIQMETSDGEPIPIRSFKPFDKKAISCNRPVQGWARDGDSGELVLDEEGNPSWVWNPETEENAPVCGTALYQFGSRYRRYPIADYITEHADGFFQMLMVDEIQHYKGKSSDRGIAFARLVDAARYTLGLTGTVYGGKASDIFWLLWRLGIKDIREEFSYRSSLQWVRRYGVLEERQYGGGSNSSDDEFGSFNATRRGRKVTRERPGVSPGILRYLLDNTVFLALKDLGIGLPAYKEEMVTVEMTEDQGRQYRSMSGYLKGRAQKDMRYLSTWLQRSLGRPSTGFRDEEIIKLHRENGKIVEREHLMELPAVNGRELLPKEKWLVSFVQSEAKTGRKVLLYARQTGTYDIQPRLKRVLEDVGLRVGVLTTSVGTREREAWIEQHAHEFDVLITNPRLVETGLDLVQFATIVFYEISYSLFTIWQAMRRVWRLGQSKPVKVVFTAYLNTLEESALALMGQKMGAAQLLYGDEVTGAIVPEDNG
ncbi:MAG: DEAD/DEAH box helicase, partial [Chloroflexota bacterium]|nr:DEAD/DEAH box helicase [Chloroflexota bacterium]